MSEKDLLDDLTPDQVEALKTIDFDKVKRHFANKVYKQAASISAEIRRDQIIKGAGKYPEPLNPDSWSAAQLIRHGLEENIDQQHYLVALLDKVKRMENKIDLLHDDVLFHLNRSEQYKKEMIRLIRELETANNYGEYIRLRLIKVVEDNGIKGVVIDAKA